MLKLRPCLRIATVEKEREWEGGREREREREREGEREREREREREKEKEKERERRRERERERERGGGDCGNRGLSKMLATVPFFFAPACLLIPTPPRLLFTLQFGYDHFLNSLDQVHTLHREITDFARAGTHRCLGFFLGVLDHWVSAVAVKAPYEDSVPVGDANSENGQQYKVMLVYMDSKNNDILSKNYDELLAHAAKRQEESEKRKGKPWTPREREQCVQFFEDAGKLVHSLSWCLEGRSNMLTQYLAFSVDYIIDSFICHVTPRAAAKVRSYDVDRRQY